MRINGIDPKNAPESVKLVFQRSYMWAGYA